MGSGGEVKVSLDYGHHQVKAERMVSTDFAIRR
jgi:hypothetical protein